MKIEFEEMLDAKELADMLSAPYLYVTEEKDIPLVKMIADDCSTYIMIGKDNELFSFHTGEIYLTVEDDECSCDYYLADNEYGVTTIKQLFYCLLSETMLYLGEE